MKKRKSAEEPWETPSLEWIHRVRREMHMERKGKRVQPLGRADSEKLAKKYGLKLVEPRARGAR
jgi:hypothetical protein